MHGDWRKGGEMESGPVLRGRLSVLASKIKKAQRKKTDSVDVSGHKGL